LGYRGGDWVPTAGATPGIPLYWSIPLYWGVRLLGCPDQTLQAAPWLPVDSSKERGVFTAIASRADRSEEFPKLAQGISLRQTATACPAWLERTRAGEPLVPVRGLKVPMTVGSSN
jgi:hypothetical protein